MLVSYFRCNETDFEGISCHFGDTDTLSEAHESLSNDEMSVESDCDCSECTDEYDSDGIPCDPMADNIRPGTEYVLFTLNINIVIDCNLIEYVN